LKIATLYLIVNFSCPICVNNSGFIHLKRKREGEREREIERKIVDERDILGKGSR
jgi:hypothetical protein